MPPPEAEGGSCPATEPLPHLDLPAWCTAPEPEEAVSVAWWVNTSVSEWQNRAMAAAGIDPAKWDPSDGFEDNQENIKKVYALYAEWYLKNPELKWAGMAKLAGGSVYGGLLKLVDERPPWLSGWNIIAPVVAYRAAKRRQMDKLERIFVGMQKNIFMDLAWQHQAYVEGGMGAITAAYHRGDMSAANYEAWQKISSPDKNAQWEGNKALLMREQSEILPPAYEDIRDLTGGGKIADNISENTKSPIPGGKPFQELYPDGDVTKFEDRWKWIDNHMLPEYKALGEEHTRTLAKQPLEELAKREFAPAPRRSP